MTRPWKVLLIASAGVFMASLDLFIVNVAFPDIAADFDGARLDSLSWVLNAYAIVYAALIVPAGRWADRIGRKRAFLAGLALFTLASALCAAAPDLGWLVAARVLQGAGAAILVPTSLALVLPEFPPEKRGMAVGVWAAVGGVAAALGPPVGGVLVELDWRWVFLVNIPVGVAALVYGARVLAEAREEPAGPRPDVIGAVALAAGIGALVLALVRTDAWGWGDERVLGLFAAAVVLVAVIAVRSARHPAPLVDPEIMRVSRFRAATAASLVYHASFGALLLGQVLFLTQVWDLSVLTAGLALAPGPFMAAAFAAPAGRAADRYGPRAVAVPGILIWGVATLWWLANTGPEEDYLGSFLAPWMLGGVGVGLTLAPLAGAATAGLPPARFATGSAVFAMTRQIGTALGVALLVAVLGTSTPGGSVAAFEDAWILVAALAAVAAVIAFGIGAPARKVAPVAAVATSEVSS